MAEYGSDEWRANISVAVQRAARTPEVRQRIGEGVRRAYAALSPEERQRRAQAKVGRGRGHPGDVPVAPIREAVLAEIARGTTWTDLCRRIGWMERRPDGREAGEVTRLKRALGITPQRGSRRVAGGVTVKRTQAVRHETALLLVVDGLQRDPHEFGL